jgi:hypothetical protein
MSSLLFPYSDGGWGGVAISVLFFLDVAMSVRYNLR